MELRKFKLINNIIAIVILFISALTYLLTIESTASFWDCGEFIASSMKLEVGHPPGNPVFQLIARIFTLFGDNMQAAVLINAMSALCSAFTIFFLYLTIVHFGKRIIEKTSDTLTIANCIAIFGAGITGSLAYCWSDTFWFSAVEGEVYAMSSLFTAAVLWAMLKWEEQAELPYANRWIILIAFLMGLSIGVHLLNLLTIPALVFLYYYKKYEVTTKRTIYVLAISIVILAFILYGIIPYMPKIAAYTDLLFVNVFGLPINSGAVFFVLAALALCVWGFYETYKKNKVLLNTIILCFTMIVIGYSTFAVVVIRSSANTPTNEYQPDNAFTLVRYLGREQYGSAPLIYGETYASPVVDLKQPKYYNIVDGKYAHLDSPFEPIYDSNTKMLFPRMYTSGAGDQYVSFYDMYTNGSGRTIPNSKYKMPSFKSNLAYFFDYQIGYMYIRYFMWNFVGRQNDLQGTVPGDVFKGNWESGIKFLDNARLGDQEKGPDYISHSNAKNHFYFLPLILGIIGLIFQLKRDRNNGIVVTLLFILTGVAIVVYLNQTPVQARERDYAYAGSFYMFAIWIGLAVMWLTNLIKKIIKPELAAIVASILCVLVPLQMVSQTWDDHDRSGRRTTNDMAYNYLAGLDNNAILITHGDNDTFPLWYIQEVEGVRTDVRIVNTSLLGTDWYIDQMKFKQYESDPLPISIDRKQYLYGTNDYVQIYDRFEGKPILLKQAIDIFKNPKITVPLSDGKSHNYIAANKLLVPVNKENVRKYNIVSEKDMDKVLDTLEFTLTASSLNKTELILLDIISNYNWDRPIYILQRGGDVNIGIKDYLQYDGFAYKFVPIKSSTGKSSSIDAVTQMDADATYNRIMNTYKWDAFKDTTINVDYQNLLTFNSLISLRDIFTKTAQYLASEKDTTRAIELLDKMQEVVPDKNFPLNNSIISPLNDYAVINAIAIYLNLGEKQKGDDLANKFYKETEKSILLFSGLHDGSMLSYDYLRQELYFLLKLSEVYNNAGYSEEAKKYSELVNKYVETLNE
jgi:Protein of unknown function (DUF2723).